MDKVFYCEIQAAKILKWVKLFLMMSSYQKLEVFREDEEKPFYEGTVSDVTFEDLAEFAAYAPAEIAAKDKIIVITSVESPDN